MNVKNVIITTTLGLALTLKWPLSLQADLYCSAHRAYCDSAAPRPHP